MSVKINGTTITLTRGDTLKTKIRMFDPVGEEYIPSENDRIRFAMKQKYSDYDPILVIDIPTDTCVLHIKPEDTKELDFGRYVYDIELTMEDGTVDTFITRATLKLSEEVY